MCIVAIPQFYFDSFGQTNIGKKKVLREGGPDETGCMVDRLGAGFWDKAWRQRKLENSSGWNKGCDPHQPPPSLKSLPHFPPAVLLTDGSEGGWVDGL